MNRTLLMVFLSCVGLSVLAQDIVILRTGDELEGKVINASQNAVSIDVKKSGGLFTKETVSTTIDPATIYMIKFKERGNLYFKDDGTRVSGEKQKLDSSADIIYLVNGKEIQAYDLSLQPDHITFRTIKKPQKAQSASITEAKSDVFMIKYSDGSRDIITDITPRSEPEAVEIAQPIQEEPQIKVVFHTVKAGDTLKRIAEEYSVTVEEIREWNEISPQIKENANLKAGAQYMIQQTIKK